MAFPSFSWIVYVKYGNMCKLVNDNFISVFQLQSPRDILLNFCETFRILTLLFSVVYKFSQKLIFRQKVLAREWLAFLSETFRDF